MEAATPNLPNSNFNFNAPQAHLTLMKLLYRADCPPSIDLGEYRLGLLDKMRRSAIVAHLSECPHCTEELARLDGYLTLLQPQEEAAPSLTERLIAGVRVLVAELMGGPRHILAMRGTASAEAEPLLYSAEEIQVALDPQSDPAQPNAILLMGLITGTDTAHWHAQLRRENQLIATTDIDEIGNFSFSALLPGQYQLVVGDNKVEVRLVAELV